MINKLQELLLSLPDGDHWVSSNLLGGVWLINKKDGVFNSKFSVAGGLNHSIKDWRSEDFQGQTIKHEHIKAYLIDKEELFKIHLPMWEKKREHHKSILDGLDAMIEKAVSDCNLGDNFVSDEIEFLKTYKNTK